MSAVEVISLAILINGEKPLSSQSMTLPEIIIGGAPKCGTSSLYTWLTAHPAISGGIKKELFYLMDAGHPLSNPAANYLKCGLEEYGSLFPDVPSANLRVDATTHYLYQETALSALEEAPVKPLIIFVLRDPAERLYSSFNYTRNNIAAFKKTLLFADYVELLLSEGQSQLARYIAYPPSLYVLQRDLRYGCYADYLARWRVVVPGERLLVSSFHELKSAPRVFMQTVASILGVDPSFYDSCDFARHNETYHIKNPKVHRAARTLARRVKPYAGSLWDPARRLYLQWQAGRGTENTERDHEALGRLRAFYAPYNKRLSLEYGVELDAP